MTNSIKLTNVNVYVSIFYTPATRRTTHHKLDLEITTAEVPLVIAEVERITNLDTEKEYTTRLEIVTGGSGRDASEVSELMAAHWTNKL